MFHINIIKESLLDIENHIHALYEVDFFEFYTIIFAIRRIREQDSQVFFAKNRQKGPRLTGFQIGLATIDGMGVHGLVCSSF